MSSEAEKLDIDDILDSVDGQGLPAIEIIRDARKGGRPRNDAVPALKGEDRIKDMKRFASRNPLVKHVEAGRAASLDMIDTIMRHLTQEIAYLEFAQNERLRKGDDPADLSTKKISALKGLADIWFKKRDQVLDEMFDLKSARMQAVFEYFMQTISEACQDSGMAPELTQVFFNKLGARLEGWEEDAAVVARKVEADGGKSKKGRKK